MPAKHAKLLWLAYAAAAMVGFGLLWAHEYEAGYTSIAPAERPLFEGFEPTPGHALIAMSVHPKCPCTARALETLERLWLRRDPSAPVDLAIFLTIPEGKDPSFARGKTARRALSIPGARVILDPDGALARKLAAVASGQVAAYRPDGTLAFSGGLTVTRSHGGDSAGVAIVEALLHNRIPRLGDATITPVYGCSLQ